MLSNAPFFLALRYLRPKRSFVSIITFISVLGVMLGVGVLVVVMSVFKGWQVEFKKLLLGFEPHVVMTQEARYTGEVPEGAPPPFRSNWREVLKQAQAWPGVVSATPMAEGGVAVRLENSDPEGAELFGLRADADSALLRKLEKHITKGKFDLKGDNIIITDRLAKKLNIKMGDVLSVLASDTIRQMIQDLRAAEETQDAEAARAARAEIVVLPRDLTVVGIVRADTAGERCYTPLNVAQELFNLEGDVSGIELELADPEQAEAFAYRVYEKEDLPVDWSVRTWNSTHGTQLQAVENQQSLMYFLLFFIMLVAAICVMNTTITVTVQKRREIGILTALGSRSRQIIAIFLAQAGVVASLGILAGLAGGMTVLHFRNDLRRALSQATGRDFFPQDIYFLSEIPAHVQVTDLASICGLAVVLCLLAALIPAWFAARVDPAVALRDVQ
ncbi:MAG TPA: ABC transporter permease [Prosthecobacter sp.]